MLNLKTKPRILFVSYTSEWTGPNVSLLWLVKDLRHHYDVKVVLPEGKDFCQTLAEEKIPFISFPSLGRSSIRALFRLIRQEKIDLVYGNNSGGASRNSLLAAKCARVPFICHVREMGWGKPWSKNGYLRFANAVVAVSQSCAESVDRFVPPGRLFVIPNGIPIRSKEVDRGRARALLLDQVKLSPNHVLVVSVAHICPRKGQESAIRAFAASTDLKKLHLILVGHLERDPSYVQKVQSLIHKHKLEKHVTILGFRRDASQLLPGADIFLHTAQVDPHPRSVLEAMSANLPVVAIDVDGVGETVADGRTGYLVPKGDVAAMARALAELASSSSTRRRMGTEGRRLVVDRFSAEITSEQVKNVIDLQLENAS